MERTSGDDGTESDREEAYADREQTFADPGHAHSPIEQDRTGELYAPTTRILHTTSRDGSDAGLARDLDAEGRDLAATARDRTAERRDREADQHDAEMARLGSGMGEGRAVTGAQIILRAARERRRAETDRARAAAQRADAACDRELAARDRQLAADDRAQAAAERAAATLDSLTGAWLRGPGLAQLQREIDRVRRGSGRLVVAYLDVDGLKAINDTKGHAAGDEILRHTVEVLRAHLRSYELIIRVGGDEFLCAVSEATIDDVRARFDRISSALSVLPGGGSITVGFGELQPDEDPMDTVERADRDLLAVRGRSRRGSARIYHTVDGQK